VNALNALNALSVRMRLTLWYVALLCLGFGIFAGAVVWQDGQAASDALDQTLQHRAQDVAGDLQIGRSIVLHADAPDEGERRPGEPALWVRVLDERGRVAVRQGPPLTGMPAALLSDTRSGIRTVEEPGDHHVRLLVQPLRRDGRRVTVQLITTTDALEAERGHLLVAMGLAGVAILGVAALGGFFVADRALRPVDRITRLAAGIGAGDLHRRVGVEVWGDRATGGQAVRDDELGRLARTFDAMLGRLEEAAERRRILTADAAHELCTPIAIISSGAEIALRRRRDADDDEATLRHIMDASAHMGRMVEDLLLLARADGGRLPLRRELVEIDEVCRSVARSLQPLAAERGVTLSVDLPARTTLVMGDEAPLGQVVRNLLDNALHYTPAGGHVALTVRDRREGPRGEPEVEVCVCDTGPGIPAPERERIFERFHRVRDSGDSGEDTAVDATRHAGGSGLGLAICKAIVTAHGGRISVDDAPSHAVDGRGRGRGARFIVALPGATEESEESEVERDGATTGTLAVPWPFVS